MRVRGEAQYAASLRGCARTLIRPSGTFSRREKGQSPSPLGRGVGVRVRGEATLCGMSTRLRTYPHPPLRGTFSRREKGQRPSPSGEGLG